MPITDVAEAVARLIDRYDLHGSYEAPIDRVDLWPLEDLFPIMRRDIAAWGIDALVIPPAGEIGHGNPAIVTIGDHLDDYHARLAYAHEIGHALHGHAGTLRMAGLDKWFDNRAELEAWRVAAQLLVPVDTIVRMEETALIAAACGVPPWLVGLV